MPKLALQTSGSTRQLVSQAHSVSNYLDTQRNSSIYFPYNMRRRGTILILILAMVGSTVGVGAHQSESSCAFSNLPDCCKKALSASNSRQASIARVCCNLNCSEPGTTGSNSSSSFSSSQLTGMMPATVVMPVVAPRRTVLLQLRKTSPFQEPNPKYIQHLALLI